MEPASEDASPQPTDSAPRNIEHDSTNVSGQNDNADTPVSSLSDADTSSFVINPNDSESSEARQGNSQTGDTGMSKSSYLTGGLGRILAIPSARNETDPVNSGAEKPGVIGSIAKGLLDTSKTAVKKAQVTARRMISQNKFRFQEGGFDLDLAYITENIIAMGVPAENMEGFYRNDMNEVIRFFETYHEGKYKVYNLCSERSYDASLFQGRVECFPFDDHNCPPIEFIASFCESASSWLKEDVQNVVAVHCKAGMARTGVMICSLFLFLKLFGTAEEAIKFFNEKRCSDGKALVLPSQIRYVKYFDRTLTNFKGEVQPGRRCMLRGFRLHNPSGIRPSITISNHNGILFDTKKHQKTKDLSPEVIWILKNEIAKFALRGEPGLTELTGDFKIHFHDRKGDFYCWLNTTMIGNREILDASDLDDFDKRKTPAPGFQVEIVMADYDGTLPSTNEDDDLFSDSEGEENQDSKSSEPKAIAMAADASVFSFADDEDFAIVQKM